MAIELKALYIEGQFDDNDWLALLALLRNIESHHPEHSYKAYIIDGTKDMSPEEVMEFFRRSMPERPGRRIETVFKRNHEPGTSQRES